MEQREMTQKVLEMSNVFDGVKTHDVYVVLANFIAGLIVYSVDDGKYDDALEAFTGLVWAGVKQVTEGGEQ